MPTAAEVDIVIRPQHLKIDFDRGGRGPNPDAGGRHAGARARCMRARYLGRESLVEFRDGLRRLEADGLGARGVPAQARTRRFG